MAINSFYCEANQNQIFNHNFEFPNRKFDFPAGWKKCHGYNTANFYWKKDPNQNHCIVINNRKKNNLASIRQERTYKVSVHEKQVWEVGAMLKADNQMSATIKVHFVSHSSHVISTQLNFIIMPGDQYYSGIVTVPKKVDFALIEIGTSDVRPLCIRDVYFKRTFPIEKYNTDSQSRLNINRVESIGRILEPVDVNGTFDLVRPVKDFSECLTAGTIERTSTIQDVMHLATYSFCVINEGCIAAVVQAQLSPNRINWLKDSSSNVHIDAGQIKIIVYNQFARYVRLKYRTVNATTNLRIYFQGQG